MVKAYLQDAALIKPPAEVHLVMDRESACWLRDILATAHTGAFYQELVKLLGTKGSS